MDNNCLVTWRFVAAHAVACIVVFIASVLAINSSLGDEKQSPRDEPPLSSFVVMQCDEVVVAWVVLQNNSVYRTDAEHHPDDPNEYKAFLEWLKTGQIDVYQIPCNRLSVETHSPKKGR